MASNLNEDEKQQLEDMIERNTACDVLEYMAELLRTEADRCREAHQYQHARRCRIDAQRLEACARHF